MVAATLMIEVWADCNWLLPKEPSSEAMAFSVINVLTIQAYADTLWSTLE